MENLPTKLESYFPAITNWKLRVVFPQSHSIHYRNVVRLAKLMDSYHEKIEPDGTILHMVGFESSELRRFKVLRGITENWRGCLFFIGDEIVDIDDLGFLECYRGKLMTRNYDQYCLSHLLWEDRKDSPFTCKLMFDKRRSEKWYEIGIFDNDIFYVDKPKIEEIIIDTARYNRYCPALDIKEIEKRINNLPEIINPRKDKGWEYDGSYYSSIHYGVKKNYRCWRTK